VTRGGSSNARGIPDDPCPRACSITAIGIGAVGRALREHLTCSGVDDHLVCLVVRAGDRYIVDDVAPLDR